MKSNQKKHRGNRIINCTRTPRVRAFVGLINGVWFAGHFAGARAYARWRFAQRGKHRRHDALTRRASLPATRRWCSGLTRAFIARRTCLAYAFNAPAQCVRFTTYCIAPRLLLAPRACVPRKHYAPAAPAFYRACRACGTLLLCDHLLPFFCCVDLARQLLRLRLAAAHSVDRTLRAAPLARCVTYNIFSRRNAPYVRHRRTTRSCATARGNARQRG